MYSVISDSDPKALKTFFDAYTSSMSPLENSSKSSTQHKNLLIAWENAAHIPISSSASETCYIWVIGHIEEIEQTTSPADYLLKQYQQHGYMGLSGHTGFFFYILTDESKILAGTDLLGLYPAYFYHSSQTLIISANPSTPRYHPNISVNPDLHGIAGILYSMHEIDNRSIWEGVKRIPAGHILSVEKSVSNLIPGKPIPISDDYFSLPFDCHVDLANEAMEKSLQRYNAVDFLLSGGLDSRLIAGYLKRGNIESRICHTLGKKSDIEWSCAAPVARYLNAEHQVIEVDFRNYDRYFRSQIFNEQLANGCTDLGWWALVDIQRSNKPLPYLNGLLGDAILGGSHISWALNFKKRRYDTKQLLERINLWGLDKATIKRIFRSNMSSILNEVIDTIKSNYNALPGYEFQKAWQYDLQNRQRYHIAGVLYRIAYNFWPGMPYTSRSILRCAGGIPASSLMQRRVQKELLRREFPNLAKLPLDNNTLDPTALSPTVLARINKKIRRYIPSKHVDIRMACYYHRMFDITNNGWQPLFNSAINHLNELNNDIIDANYTCQIFEEKLEAGFSKNISSTTGIKNALAFSYWLKTNRSG